MTQRNETSDHYVNSGELKDDRDEYLLALAHIATSHDDADASSTSQFPSTD